MTPGWKTTEFWATLLTHVFAITTSIYVLAAKPFPTHLAALQVLVPIAAFVASSLVQAGYNLSRGRVKAAMLNIVGALDDIEAIWNALFPGRPIPPAVTDAAMTRRAGTLAASSSPGSPVRG